MIPKPDFLFSDKLEVAKAISVFKTDNLLEKKLYRLITLLSHA